MSGGVADGMTPSSPDVLLRSTLATWRDSLINLTGTNRLLNFKPRRTSTVLIKSPDASIVLAGLRAGTEWNFEAVAGEGSVERLGDGGGAGLPLVRGERLKVIGDEKDLSGALRNLLKRSAQEYMDRGLWILYLAVGTLTWAEADGSEMTSPLLLVPVRLNSRGPKQTPYLTAADEDAVVNPALVLKMREFDVRLPAVGEAELADLNSTALLSQVRVAIAGQPSFTVAETVALSYFSFTKEAMYRDLLDNEDLVLDNDLVQALGARSGQASERFLFEPISDNAVDERAPAESTPLVLDADSSQRACIAAAVAGESFVMDGPPGTGKSQTIANMIGAALHAGKTVLFASEKAAALEVVRNRLAEAGLGNYLLELHSHKATRKEVAGALGHALGNVPVAPAGLSAMDRIKVQSRRVELNAYADAMNRVRNPLGYSLHHVLGMIGMLNDIPVAPATGVAPVDLTVGTFADIRENALRIARAWRPATQGSSFVWRDVTATGSMDARLYQANAALEELRGVTRLNAALANAFGLTRTIDASVLASLVALLTARPAGVPSRWLTTATLSETEATYVRLREGIATVDQAKQAASTLAGRTWQAIPCEEDLPVVAAQDLAALDPVGLPLDALTAHDLTGLSDRFSADAAMIDDQAMSLDGLASALGLPPVKTFAEAGGTLRVAALAQEQDRPLMAWFTPVGLDRAQTAVSVLASMQQTVARAGNDAKRYYTEQVLTADVEALHQRFNEVHIGLKKLGGSYRADKKAVTSFAVETADRQAVLSHLGLAVAWKGALRALEEAEKTHASSIGTYYRGPNTDWTAVQHACEHVRTASKFARTDDLTNLAANVALDGQPNPSLAAVAQRTRDALNPWAASLAPAPVNAARPQLCEGTLRAAAAWLRTHSQVFAAAATYTAAVSQPLERTLTVREAQEHVRAREAVTAAQQTFASQTAAYQDALGDLYNGTETDLDAVEAALHWARSVRHLVTGSDAALTVEQVIAAERPILSPNLAASATSWRDASAALLDAFGPTRTDEIRGDFSDYEDAASLLADLAKDIVGKDEWFAYTAARGALAAHGLDTAIDFCIQERVPAAQVPQILERALLQEWADHHLANDTALSTVRAEDRDALVEEYKRLDKALIGTAASDVIHAVNNRRPSTDIGESSVIQREAVKKSRHLPVRALIERTRHVTQAIKPVFMMSPLSVSQYLPPDMTFDIVIFDEASQVSPADAINCIYRGRALITAGDQKQLPPTSFFGAVTNSEEDGDWDEDVDDFESVLDLAKSSGSLRSLTLRWHYRSRHEDLIAFSNASFYEGKLITFPGAQEHGPDVGVEHIQVPGVYRRGSTRDNPVEAKKVAERVLHHYATRPNLTLGVVTFSESQATAIEYALEAARATRPDLDRHFTDNRLGGFFVKSLESVQGDERDIMIFSLGYGPDENGKMTQNFGPLNRAGGWRRLNVAITRARCRNEVISSFGAAGIPAAASSEGVRHLRRYLDFAARGTAALGLDLTHSLGDAESPFEESVLAVIRSWGYDVVPQIGAAGYRIDMAVRHPDQPGAFALGIECDGFMYHSSKVARDRDRLREQVLRGLGWHLHRIWGSAWYRNRNAEEDRLRSAIERALLRPVRGLLSVQEDQIDRPLVQTQEAILPDTPAWAKPYRVANVKPLDRWIDPSDPGTRFSMTDGVLEAVVVEGPVHIDVLTQRLREAWNIGRVGSRIRDNIDGAINASGVTRDGLFLSIPGNPSVVRTPGEGVTRTVEQVHDDELSSALVAYVHDSGSVSSDTLLIAVARLFGWTRRGADITARLTSLLQTALDEGLLIGTSDAVRAPTRA